MSYVLRHSPCPACREKGNDTSGNNLAEYSDGGKFCFACRYTVPSKTFLASVGRYESPEDAENTRQELILSEEVEIISEEQNEIVKSRTTSGKGYRGIRSDTAKFFGVRYELDEETREVVKMYYPATMKGNLCGYKVRKHPKEFCAPVGYVGKQADLGGQFRFKTASRTVVVVGGEIDQLSAFQMLRDYQVRSGKENYEPTAVVTSLVGENATATQARLQYAFLNQFQKIILCLDSDDAGKAATEALVKVLPKGKVYIMQMDLKDPNLYLTENREVDFIDCFWRAKQYIPAGIIGSDNLFERVLESAAISKVPLPPFMRVIQKMFAGGMPLGYIINFGAQSGIGKCLGYDTPIVMHDGTVKKVQDVQIGDLLMGPDSTPRTVLSLARGREQLYRVDQGYGDSYVVNESHILSFKVRIASPDRGWKKNDIVNLTVKEYLSLSKTARNCYLMGWKSGVNFSDRKVSNPYVLGYWLGDGTTSQPAITVSDTDRQSLIDECKDFSVSSQQRKPGANCTTNYFKGLLKFLNESNLLNNKHIPLKYMTASYEDRLELAAGLIDSDGHLIHNCYEIVLKNKALARDATFLFRSLGYRCTVRSKMAKAQTGPEREYQRLFVSGHIDRIPVRLDRKKAERRKMNKDPLVSPITVTPVGEGDYYGFEINGDRLFLLGDFTVTHNTSLVNEMIYYWIYNSPHRIGIISMELDAGQYGQALLSRHLGQKISLFENSESALEYLNSETVVKAANELFKDDLGVPRFHIIDDRDGKIAHLQEKIEELIVSCNCKVIVCDPLSDMLDGLSNDEQAVFMKWMKGMIKSHKVTFVNICHTRKSQGGKDSTKEEARWITEEDFSGSGTIFKSAGANVLLMRNKYSDDPIERNTTRAFISKNRWAGQTGPAGEFFYNNETHTLFDKEEYFGHNPQEAGSAGL